MRKNFAPAKYLQEKYFRAKKVQWHDGARLTALTIAREPRNLAHSISYSYNIIFNSLAIRTSVSKVNQTAGR